VSSGVVEGEITVNGQPKSKRTKRLMGVFSDVQSHPPHSLFNSYTIVWWYINQPM
jgi:hypothetical protein